MLQQVIQVFCRVPEPGKVKTRLIPELGEEGAAKLAMEMIAGLCLNLTGDYDLEIWQSGEGDLGSYPTFHQEGDGLGHRMQAALENGLSRSGKVVLVGTDCPLVDSAYIESALGLLGEHDVVLGPVEDGGYCLVGVTGKVPPIFRGIDWGTDKVLAQTCQVLNQARISYALLPLIWDVDRPEDLPRYYAYRDSIAPR